jgi:3-dehydroquinate dehydratase II
MAAEPETVTRTPAQGTGDRRIAILHGPNLQLLGRREPGVYGHATLAEIDARIASLASELGASAESFQSNHEGELLDWIAAAADRVAGFVVNPGGLTHTSVVLRDALLATGLPFVEVHLSNTAAREPFRHRSYLTDRAAGVVLVLAPRAIFWVCAAFWLDSTTDPRTPAFPSWRARQISEMAWSWTWTAFSGPSPTSST